MEQMRPLSIRAAGRQAGCLQMNSETLKYRWMIVPWFFRPEGPLLTMESGKPSGPTFRSRPIIEYVADCGGSQTGRTDRAHPGDRYGPFGNHRNLPRTR